MRRRGVVALEREADGGSRSAAGGSSCGPRPRLRARNRSLTCRSCDRLRQPAAQPRCHRLAKLVSPSSVNGQTLSGLCSKAASQPQSQALARGISLSGIGVLGVAVGFAAFDIGGALFGDLVDAAFDLINHLHVLQHEQYVGACVPLGTWVNETSSLVAI